MGLFCPRCGSLFLPKDGKMVCPSCKVVSKSDYRVGEKKKKRDSVFISEKRQDEQDLPKVKQECSSCGHDYAYFWTQQTRAADEPETKFFKCVKCGKSWRDYS